MRLYLASYRLLGDTDELRNLVGANKKAVMIANASDGYGDEEARKERVERELDDLKKVGLESEELDLRDYFGKTDELKAKLAGFGLVWAKGGNVFILKRAFEQSGLDSILKQLLVDDAIAYGGYSAGAIMATSDLRGIDLVDMPDVVPPDYKAEFAWIGLGVVSYSIAPHYKSDHPESSDVDKVVEYFQTNNMPYKTLHDGEAIVINGQSEKVIST